jgi:hypothetical protein
MANTAVRPIRENADLGDIEYPLLTCGNDMLPITVATFLPDYRSGRDASVPHGVGAISVPV